MANDTVKKGNVIIDRLPKTDGYMPKVTGPMTGYIPKGNLNDSKPPKGGSGLQDSINKKK